MGVIGNTVDTLSNWAKSRDPSGKASAIVELLGQSNEILSHMRWQEGNGVMVNRTSVRIALPTVYTRQIGQAVAASTTREAQFDDTMAIIEAWCNVDVALANLQANAAAYRWNKAKAFFEAMSQEMAYLIFYGDATLDATQFNGLTPRYATITSSTALSAQNVIDGGGTASANTSMWLLTHDEEGFSGIFPVGTPAGLQHDDLGIVPLTVTAGYPSQLLKSYVDQFVWTGGIKVTDWRKNARIANIDVNNLVNETYATDLLKCMTKAYYRLPSISTPASTSGNPAMPLPSSGSRAFYCNRTVREMLEIQVLNKISNQLRYEDVDGRKVMMFKDAPIYNCDQLVNAEGRVT